MYNAVCLEVQTECRLASAFTLDSGKPSQISKVPPFLWEVLMMLPTTVYHPRISKR